MTVDQGCTHQWVAGMMYVHEEDLEPVALARQVFGETVECETCEEVYVPETDHVNYPHNPGTLYDCPACEASGALDPR